MLSFRLECCLQLVFFQEMNCRHANDSSATIGENIAVRRFARYTLGEGLAKKEENFAEEIAKATGGQ